MWSRIRDLVEHPVARVAIGGLSAAFGLMVVHNLLGELVDAAHNAQDRLDDLDERAAQRRRELVGLRSRVLQLRREIRVLREQSPAEAGIASALDPELRKLTDACEDDLRAAGAPRVMDTADEEQPPAGADIYLTTNAAATDGAVSDR